MAPAEEVLAPSLNLYALEHGWPRSAAPGMPLRCLPGAAAAIDTTRRSAGERGIHGLSWEAAMTPAGRLYREPHVEALLASMRVAAANAGVLPVSIRPLLRVLEQAQAAGTPLMRPHQYVEDALQDVVAVISARKIFGPGDSELEEGSKVRLPDVSALWTFGESSGRTTDCLPSLADILWRPRRMSASDLIRLAAWSDSLPHPVARPGLHEVLSFFETARREQAEVELDGFCTDSPEAL